VDEQVQRSWGRGGAHLVKFGTARELMWLKQGSTRDKVRKVAGKVVRATVILETLRRRGKPGRVLSTEVWQNMKYTWSLCPLFVTELLNL
jgi:hypothetical protein